MLQYVSHLAYDLVYINRLEFGRVLAGEYKEVPDYPLYPEYAVAQLDQPLAPCRGHAVLEELHIDQHRLQRVVDLVGYASRHFTEGGQLAGQHHPFLDHSILGHILGRNDEATFVESARFKRACRNLYYPAKAIPYSL